MNVEKIFSSVKKSKDKEEANQGQLDLFSIGLEDPKADLKLDPYHGAVNPIQEANLEAELIGLSISYDPLDDHQMCQELFCTHYPVDIFDITSSTNDIIIMDRVVDIYTGISKSGKKFYRLTLSKLGKDYQISIYGKKFVQYIKELFIDQIYLFQINYQEPSSKSPYASMNTVRLKNVKDVDVDGEYDRIMGLSDVSTMDEPWMFENRKEYKLNLKIYENEVVEEEIQ